MLFFLARIRVSCWEIFRFDFFSRALALARLCGSNSTPRERENEREVAAFAFTFVQIFFFFMSTDGETALSRRTFFRKIVSACVSPFDARDVTFSSRAFSSASLSLCVCVFFRRARVACECLFLREALKMWVLLLILTTRARIFSVYRLRFLCLDLLVLTLRFGLSSVPA